MKVRREQRSSHFQETWLGLRQNKDLEEVTEADGRDQHEDDCFDGSHSEALQREQQYQPVMTAQNNGM